MGRTVCFAVPADMQFAFRKARYAGRYYRGQNSLTG